MGNTVGDISISSVMEEQEAYLAHYGVKGMHWGIRKDRSEIKSLRKNPATKDVVKNLSDKELQAVVNRMRLERQYADLTTSPVVKAGRKQAAKYANKAVNTLVVPVLTAAVGGYIKSRFDHGNAPDLSRYSPNTIMRNRGRRRSSDTRGLPAAGDSFTSEMRDIYADVRGLPRGSRY